MLIPALVGLGLGVIVLMFLALQRDKRYRRLFADPHLDDLARALTQSRTSAATTTEGLSLAWQTLDVHAALVVRAHRALAPEAVRFLLGACAKAVGRDIVALLILPEGAWALVVPGPIPEVTTPSAEARDAWRVAGVEAMRHQALVPGALAAYKRPTTTTN